MSINSCTSTYLNKSCVLHTDILHSQRVHQDEAECDESLFLQGLSSFQVIPERKTQILSNNNLVTPRRLMKMMLLKEIIWISPKKKVYAA